MEYVVTVWWRGADHSETVFRGDHAAVKKKAGEIAVMAAAEKVTICRPDGWIEERIKK